jgi:ribosomal protein S18 acetylase RimI-like enzyme
MNDNPVIRPAFATDLAKVREIINLSFPRFLRFFASHSLDSEDRKALVAEKQGTTVGFAILTEFRVAGSKYGCILWLAVLPEHRRKGVAFDLVKAGAEELKTHGARAVFASVQRRNKASLATFCKMNFKRMRFLALWRLFGWHVFGFYRGIWFAPGEAVLMLD